MNGKRILLGTIAVFVVLFVLDYLIHEVGLSGLYQATASVWRPEAEMKNLMNFMLLGNFLFALIFTGIYAKGYEPEKGKVGQGFRYGLHIGTLVGVTQSLGWYAVLPIPAILPLAWFLACLVEGMIAGIVVAQVYKT